jgi:Cellulose binding domain
MVTPTFATGLGVVVAAVLASQMGAPSFRVSAPRWDGQPCATPDCEPGGSHGRPASVRGGRRIHPPAPAATAGTPTAHGKRAGSPRGDARGGVPPGQPVLHYQTQNSWPDGFEGSVTISFPTGHPPRHWWLGFSYPAGRVGRVWGPVTWHPVGEHMVVVSSAGWAGRAGRPGVHVWFQVTGKAAPPQHCHFDQVACHFK